MMLAPLVRMMLLAAGGLVHLAAQQVPPPPPPPPPPPGAGAVWFDRQGTVLPAGRVSAVIRARPGRPGDPIAQQAQTGEGAIEGSVVNSMTGAPVRRASVIIHGEQGVSKSTSTSASGVFRFDQLPEGRFHLMTQREGQVSTRGGVMALTLSKSEKKSGVVLKLQPGAAVSGRVLDEEGEPMIGVQVSLVKKQSFNGKSQFNTFNAATTDDRGEYRIHSVPPGRYRISAIERRQFPGNAERETAGMEYPVTYYPNARDVEAAQSVRLAPGAELKADFRLEPRPFAASHVRGLVVGLPEGNGNCNVMAIPLDKAQQGHANSVACGEKAEFVLRGLRPGRYNIVAHHFELRHDSTMVHMQPLTGLQSVDLSGGPVENLMIELGRGVEVSGRVRLTDGEGERAKMQTMLMPSGDGGFGGVPPQPAELAADGTFRLTGVTPGNWRINVFPLPEGSYIKSAMLGGTDVLGKDLVISGAAPGPLEVIVSLKGGVIEGAITGAEEGVSYLVRAMPADPELAYLLAFSGNAMAQPGGKFRLTGLRQGSYRILATPDHEGERANDPDLLKEIEPLMTVVKVEAGGRVTQDIKAVTSADWDKAEGLNN